MSRVLGGCRVLMAAGKVAAKGAATSTATKVAPAAGSKGGLQKPMPLSLAMSKFLGVREIARSQAVKKIWEHIKANDLQNPTNKREIRCDQKLKTIFGDKDKVGMLEIAKLISPHFLKSN